MIIFAISFQIHLFARSVVYSPSHRLFSTKKSFKKFHSVLHHKIKLATKFFPEIISFYSFSASEKRCHTYRISYPENSFISQNIKKFHHAAEPQPEQHCPRCKSRCFPPHSSLFLSNSRGKGERISSITWLPFSGRFLEIGKLTPLFRMEWFFGPASQPEQLLKLAPPPQPGSGPEECFRKIAPIKCALLRCCWHHWLSLAKESSSGERGRKLRTVNIHSAFSGLLERPRHLHKHYRWNGQKGVGGMWDFSHHKTAVL